MEPSLPRLNYLLEQYRNNTATSAERLEFMEILHSGELETPIRQWLLELIQLHATPTGNLAPDSTTIANPAAPKPDSLGPEKAEQLLSAILQAGRVEEGLHPRQSRLPPKTQPRQPEKPLHLPHLWKLAAAATLLFVITYSAFHIARHHQQTTTELASNLAPNQDVPPGKHAAVLTLANGRQITLDSTQNGTIGHQGNLTVINTKGMLSYQGLPAGTAPESTYNTLTTNAGNQYQLILPDGSKVWLNAASSIRYPMSFGSKERKVAITGEAYFEVSASASHPFFVQHGATVVQVLGTHFNMNTYDDETALTTTLLEGAIRISQQPAGVTQQPNNQNPNSQAPNSQTNQTGQNPNSRASQPNSQTAANPTNHPGQSPTSPLLHPGQQARLTPNGTLTIIDDVDLDQVIAWKNDLFDFRSADIASIMRQLTRWYGIHVEGDTQIKERFYARIPKTASLKEVLNAFELTGKVHFEIEGKTVKIQP